MPYRHVKVFAASRPPDIVDRRRMCALGISIVVTGKGGTGKTTIAGLIVRALGEKMSKAILAIDADPNSNLNEVLGVPLKKTVGNIREELLGEKEGLSPEMSKELYLEFMVHSSLTESGKFDLLAMGRPEGPGCYCYVNVLLRRIVDAISNNYPLVVMDAEAGLEHLSRRTTRDVNIMLITTDPTARSIETSRRILELSKQLQTKIGQVYAVANRVPNASRTHVVESIERLGISCIAVIPEDPFVQQYDISGQPLTLLPDDSPAYQAAREIVEKLRLEVN